MRQKFFKQQGNVPGVSNLLVQVSLRAVSNTLHIYSDYDRLIEHRNLLTNKTDF